MDEDIEEMDFDEIAEAQGWDAYSCLTVVREFISVNGYSEMLDEHARNVARTENE